MKKLFAIAVVAVLMAALTVPALAAAPVKHATVNDSGFSFGPKTLTIHKGTKVVWKWINSGGIPHDVVVKRGPAKFRSKVKTSGTYSHLFTKKGKYVIYCTIHTFMHQTIVVK